MSVSSDAGLLAYRTDDCLKQHFEKSRAICYNVVNGPAKFESRDTANWTIVEVVEWSNLPEGW